MSDWKKLLSIEVSFVTGVDLFTRICFRRISPLISLKGAINDDALTDLSQLFLGGASSLV